MNTSPYLQQRGHASTNFCKTSRRRGDSRQYFEQNALASLIGANNPYCLPLFDVERQVFECPKRVVRLRGVTSSAKKGRYAVHQVIAQGVMAILQSTDSILF